MLKLDLHVHTHHSPDGSTHPKKAIKIAEERGLDGLSFTDHDTFDRSRFVELQQRTDLVLIPGIEVSSNVGHILGYFVREPVEPWREPQEIVEDIRAQGGIAVMAHPYRLVHHYPEGYFELFDAVERFNARSGDPGTEGSPNYHTMKLLEEADFPCTGGSDSHLFWSIGNGYTLVDAARNPVAIKNAILNRKTKTKGTPSLQSNRAASQFVRLFKEPKMKSWLKIWPKSARWVGQDLVNGFKSLGERIFKV